MEATQFDRHMRQMVGDGSRRGLLRLSASLPLAGSLSAWLGHSDVVGKKRHKKKHKKKKRCGKAGSRPIKGKCCTKTILVEGTCHTCDVCASGCAFDAVQPAIDAADEGDTIVICPGTFSGDVTIDRDLTIVGGGADATVLQGTGTASVVQVSANTVELENLHVTGGASMYGSGIENAGSTLTLRNALVSENKAGFFGGGIFNNDVLLLIASEVRGNEAATGGGIYNNGAGTTLTLDADSRIMGNTARNADGGGGLYNYNGTVTLASNAIISGNTPNNCAGTAVANCTG
jgi:nitrous oxidase accessory protein NosD